MLQQEAALRAALEDLKHLLVPSNQLTILDSSPIGSGGYAKVLLATLDCSPLQSNPKKVAVKQLKLRTEETSGLPIRLALRLARELKIWAKLKHPNILELSGYHLSENFEIAQLISPFMINGNVANYIADRRPKVSQRFDLVRDVTAGVDYLHGCQPPICHGDLKPANVLINNSGCAILCDLGLASIISEAQDSSGLTTSRSLKGSPRYMSPELLQGKEMKQTLASDIWAWACTVFEILTDTVPYSDAKAEWGVIAAIVQNKPPAEPKVLPTWICKTSKTTLYTATPNLLINHLENCWNFQPERRPSATDSLRVVEMHREADRSLKSPGPGLIRLWIENISVGGWEFMYQGEPQALGYIVSRPSAIDQLPSWSVEVSISRVIPVDENSTLLIENMKPGYCCYIPLNSVTSNGFIVLHVLDELSRVTKKDDLKRFKEAVVPTSLLADKCVNHPGRQSFSFPLFEGSRPWGKMKCEVEVLSGDFPAQRSLLAAEAQGCNSTLESSVAAPIPHIKAELKVQDGREPRATRNQGGRKRGPMKGTATARKKQKIVHPPQEGGSAD